MEKIQEKKLDIPQIDPLFIRGAMVKMEDNARTYEVGNNKALSVHYDDLIKFIDDRFNEHPDIIELGTSDEYDYNYHTLKRKWRASFLKQLSDQYMDQLRTATRRADQLKGQKLLLDDIIEKTNISIETELLPSNDDVFTRKNNITDNQPHFTDEPTPEPYVGITEPTEKEVASEAEKVKAYIKNWLLKGKDEYMAKLSGPTYMHGDDIMYGSKEFDENLKAFLNINPDKIQNETLRRDVEGLREDISKLGLTMLFSGLNKDGTKLKE